MKEPSLGPQLSLSFPPPVRIFLSNPDLIIELEQEEKQRRAELQLRPPNGEGLPSGKHGRGGGQAGAQAMPWEGGSLPPSTRAGHVLSQPAAFSPGPTWSRERA